MRSPVVGAVLRVSRDPADDRQAITNRMKAAAVKTNPHGGAAGSGAHIGGIEWLGPGRDMPTKPIAPKTATTMTVMSSRRLVIARA